ncbi:MAG: hypothetical protein PHX13_11060 [Thiovulaceae bacterium]|nr:hypothetical protein [Sulfurimonadaceae bacterium]
MSNFIKTIVSLGMITVGAMISGCTQTPANNIHNSDAQLWQQFQSKQATDQLDRELPAQK